MIFTLPIPPLQVIKPEPPESLDMSGVCDRCSGWSAVVKSGPAGSEVRRAVECKGCGNKWTMTIKRGANT